MASSFQLLATLLVAVATVQLALATYYSRTCDPPSKLEYGEYYPYRPEYHVRSKITFSCNSGYRRFGPSWSICREHKGRVFWSHPPPVCKPIAQCGNLGHPLYGNVKVSGYTHGSSAFYTCNSGYRLIGNSYRRCYNGQWNLKEPVCTKILKCPKRDHPQYGYVRVTGYYPGSTAYYQCRRGYEIYGDARLTCLETGYWGGNVPVCKKIVRCPDLDDPEYGSVNQTSNKPGSTAHYECDYGFKLVGDRYRKCLYTGYWSGNEPVCKRIVCPDLDDPEYGSVNQTSNKPGSTAHYECDYGFKLVGDRYRECLYTGYWSGNEPVCKPIQCLDLDHPQYGSVTLTDRKPGSTAHYKCDYGYRLVGNALRKCLYSGYWAGKKPICKPILCPDLDDPSYGNVKLTSNKLGSTAHYYCKKGFKLVGNAWRKCLYTGYWSGAEPVCKEITRCPDLDDPRYGSVNQTGNKLGSTAHYECDYGFKLVGDEYRECLKTSYWSGKEPICKKIIWCPDLDDPRYGSVDQNGNKPGSTAHYECNKGFKLVGDEYRECLYTGYWNGSEPVCKRAICSYLVNPPYGKVDQRGNTPSSVAYYRCNYGYVLHGLRSRKCLYDGTWYGEAPVCRPVVKKVTCPPLDKPRFGNIRVFGYTPSSKAYYSCNDGYKLYGLQWTKCLSSGSWYGTPPTCRPTRY